MEKQEIIKNLESQGISYELIRGGRMIQAPAYPERATAAQIDILKSIGFQVSTSGGTWKEEFKSSGNAAPLPQSSMHPDWR